MTIGGVMTDAPRTAAAAAWAAWKASSQVPAPFLNVSSHSPPPPTTTAPPTPGVSDAVPELPRLYDATEVRTESTTAPRVIDRALPQSAWKTSRAPAPK